MSMTITQPAAQWYIREMDLEEGDYVRFYVRYGGNGGIYSGFSLAISNDSPNDVSMQTEELGITFYVEKSDAWYFKEHDFHIKYSRKYDEIEYQMDPIS
ncbi:HesB/YadR/YfhF family protein [Radiobacillus kanasensis]|uniref:HesB/YadR/YfhF family protein n=1 Tax=Radiobacillus kanasensis TaxID=2844358 RepID=UPI001E3ABCB7|nr:HesB/YadR/YfhF family protein [Radiobacillus kanasensis]UFT99193.1 HesB/YadR/YfhF family protein [Radiobacillus kanasensis]